MFDRNTVKKGQTVVIGSVLMFGILIIALSIYQSSVVPQQNQSVEGNHYTELRSDMNQYYTSIDQTQSLESSSVSITLSQSYPTRLFTLNAPPFTTRLEASENNPTEIRNFQVKGSNNEVDYWNQKSVYTVPNTSVSATPDYNYSTAEQPIVYENKVLYLETDSLEPVIAEQESFVQENKLDISGYVANFDSPTSEEQRISIDQVSSSPDSIYITGQNGNPIVIDIYTKIPEVTWRRILNISNSSTIQSTNYDSGTNRLSVRLDPTQTYVLNGNVSGTNPDSTVRAYSNPAYITNLVGNQVISGQTITLSVNDRLGNSSRNSLVEVTNDPQNCIRLNQKQTTSQGQVFFTCQSNQNTSVSFEINNGSESYETVTVDVQGSNRNNNGGGNNGGTDPIKINNLQGFAAENNGFTVDQIQIQDSDGDLSSVDYEVTEQNGSVIATKTESISGSQYQNQNISIPANSNINANKKYILTVTATDSNGDTATATRDSNR